MYRDIVVPAAMPAVIAGLKQGWAFSWRSLMAGELLVIIANKPSIGSRLKFEQEFADSPGLISWMLIILIIGVVVDAVFFGSIERVIRERRGLGET
jgi:NitT/TauT family transport system permease protein